MEKEDSASRRSVLKTTGISLATLGGVSSTAYATDRQAAQNNNNPADFQTTVIRENEESKLVKVTKVGRTEGTVKKKFLFHIGKKEGSVSVVDTAAQGEKLQQDNIGTQNHTSFIERSDGDFSRIGNCGGQIFDNHYVAGVAIETGDSLEKYDKDLGMALGALIGGGIGAFGGALGAVVGGALGILVGVAVDAVFFSHYDMSGRTFTLLAWDVHPAIEKVKVGGFPGYDASAGPSRSVAAPVTKPGHLGAGEAISDYF